MWASIANRFFSVNGSVLRVASLVKGLLALSWSKYAARDAKSVFLCGSFDELGFRTGACSDLGSDMPLLDPDLRNSIRTGGNFTPLRVAFTGRFVSKQNRQNGEAFYVGVHRRPRPKFRGWKPLLSKITPAKRPDGQLDGLSARV